MKRLVIDFHALKIIELARGGWLDPSSKFNWIWRTHKGTQETSVTISVLQEALELVFPMDVHRVHQGVRLTYTIGTRGGRRPWFLCPVCRRRVGVLYHANGLPFRCRICCQLAYPSQFPSRDQSYGRQPRMMSHQERDRLSAQSAVGS